MPETCPLCVTRTRAEPIYLELLWEQFQRALATLSTRRHPGTPVAVSAEAPPWRHSSCDRSAHQGCAYQVRETLRRINSSKKGVKLSAFACNH